MEKEGAEVLATLAKVHFRTAHEVAPEHFAAPPPRRELAAIMSSDGGNQRLRQGSCSFLAATSHRGNQTPHSESPILFSKTVLCHVSTRCDNVEMPHRPHPGGSGHILLRRELRPFRGGRRNGGRARTKRPTPASIFPPSESFASLWCRIDPDANRARKRSNRISICSQPMQRRGICAGNCVGSCRLFRNAIRNALPKGSTPAIRSSAISTNFPPPKFCK